MFAITFIKSRSKNFKEILDVCSYFDDYSCERNKYSVKMTVQELFQKWEFFNLLFWRTVKWKHSTFTFDNIEFFSHCDKTKIFYALQQSHCDWINLYQTFSARMIEVYKKKITEEQLRSEVFTDKEIDNSIDRFLRNTGRYKYYERFGNLNFKAPLANSDFYGRRLVRKIKENEENENKNNIK